MRYIINLYGEDSEQVITVAEKLSCLSTIPIVDTSIDVVDNGIIISTHHNVYVCAITYNHCIDTNDFIDDHYIVDILTKSFNVFFNTKKNV